MKTTVNLILSMSGFKMPPAFMIELAQDLRQVIDNRKQQYKELTGADLEMSAGPGGASLELAGSWGELGAPDAEGMVDATPAQVAIMMDALTKGVGLTESEATEALAAPQLDPAIAEKLVAYLKEAGHFTEEDARELLESGPQVDEWGATAGCECDGCKNRRRLAAARYN